MTCRLNRFLSKTNISLKDTKKTDDITADADEKDIFVERIRIESMKMRF